MEAGAAAPQSQQSNEVAVLIIDLLPTDAPIHCGRPLHYRAGLTPQPGIAQLQRI